jgi:hypothetical protein
MIQLGDEVIWPEAEESHYHEHFMVLNIYQECKYPLIIWMRKLM